MLRVDEPIMLIINRYNDNDTKHDHILTMTLEVLARIVRAYAMFLISGHAVVSNAGQWPHMAAKRGDAQRFVTDPLTPFDRGGPSLARSVRPPAGALPPGVRLPHQAGWHAGQLRRRQRGVHQCCSRAVCRPVWLYLWCVARLRTECFGTRMGGFGWHHCGSRSLATGRKAAHTPGRSLHPCCPPSS